MDDMAVNVQLPPELQQATQHMVKAALDQAIDQALQKASFPPYMTQQEACKYLHVAPSTFNQWLKKYKVPVIRIEGVKRYARSSLDKFMKTLEE